MNFSDVMRQQTLRRPIHCAGIGVHTGHNTAITLRPAPPDTGYLFRRHDPAQHPFEIPADWRHSVETPLCTQLKSETGAVIMTVEHLLSALAGCGIDNCIIDIIGSEVPIMDGSAGPFVALIESAGIVRQAAGRRVFKVLKAVTVGDEAAWARIEPHTGFAVSFKIEFDDPAIGRQAIAFEIEPEVFKAEISPARTFGFIGDVARLRASGRALGASLENAVVIDDGRIVNEGGLRYPDEFVRHKVLDVIGDLALAGRPLIGRFTGYRSSHALTRRLLASLFADETAWVSVPPDLDAEAWPEYRRVRA